MTFFQNFTMVGGSRGRHWDPNPKFLGSIFQNFGIWIRIDFSNVWDWAWDYKVRTKSQEIPQSRYKNFRFYIHQLLIIFSVLSF